jgi:sulfatase modifying factor 1
MASKTRWRRSAPHWSFLLLVPWLSACSGSSGHDDGAAANSAAGGSGAINAGGNAGSNAGSAGSAGSSAGSAGSSAGSAGSSAGSGGALGGSAGAGDAAGSVSAPCNGPLEEMKNGLCVAKTVALPDGFSIDATEVTRGQYASWLSTMPALPSASDPLCGTKMSYAVACTNPGEALPPPASDEHPVVCVDQCDARAYCAGVGKRLCGKMGGGPNALSDFANAAASQWYAACSSGGVNAYCYGNTMDPTACNGYQRGSTPLPVGSLATCQSSVSGYQGVYDLSGNVYEWEDSCDTAAVGPYCRTRGGSTVGMTNCAVDIGANPLTAYDDIGFRCCSP